MSDMITKCSEKQRELKELLQKNNLTKKEKEIVRTAMEFSYASAFCARTCDMNENWFGADHYETDYKHMLEEVK